MDTQEYRTDISGLGYFVLRPGLSLSVYKQSESRTELGVYLRMLLEIPPALFAQMNRQKTNLPIHYFNACVNPPQHFCISTEALPNFTNQLVQVIVHTS